MVKLLGDKEVDLKQLIQGDVIEGIVVSISPKEVLLDVGAKSEGVVMSDELGDSTLVENLKPGDSVLAYVMQSESDQGHITLSFKRAQRERSWRDAEVAYKNESVLEVTVLEYNKGGLLVDCSGLRGFVPLSHLDRVHFTEDMAKFAAGSEAELKESLQVLSGKKLVVKVIEIDREKNRLVLSEKDAMSTYSPEIREEKLSSVNIGDELDGVVTGVMAFGLFVDMEGIEGLVHISEIAWEKVSHPGNYYTVGAPIRVKVIGVDEESKKLALSVKQLMDNPWLTAVDKYPVGAKVSGTVSKIVPFGAFVTLEKGLDGLIHVSEATRSLVEGEQVEAVVTNVEAENQKLALTMRESAEEPVKTEEKAKKATKSSEKEVKSKKVAK